MAVRVIPLSVSYLPMILTGTYDLRSEKDARKLAAIALVAAGYGGDMDEELANALLDDMDEVIELTPNGPAVALNIPIGQWHTIRSLESGSCILEMKNGVYEPTQDCDILKM